ncbi:hypothetical protein P8605_02160 [Streptomyces sp. T-3]|nr:hypothetical protein [Streptomyces sp. T-3]
MTRIPRHDERSTSHLEIQLEIANSGFQQKVGFLKKTPSWFSNALAGSIYLLNLRCSVDAEAEKVETWVTCVTAMQVGSALFTSARATTDAIECRIGHELHTIRGGDLSRAHTGN